MKERKEAIIQLAFAISGWATKRGRASLRGEEKDYERCDRVIDYWIDHLEQYIKNQTIEIKK